MVGEELSQPVQLSGGLVIALAAAGMDQAAVKKFVGENDERLTLLAGGLQPLPERFGIGWPQEIIQSVGGGQQDAVFCHLAQNLGILRVAGAAV